MTVDELILIDKREVRRDSNLMLLYLGEFQKTFNYKPNCASCSFNSDWQKFVNYFSKKTVTLRKEKIMENGISIKKIQGKILSYKKDGKTFRLYDNILTPGFISEYLTHGTKEEIEERKKLFNISETWGISTSKTIEEVDSEIKSLNKKSKRGRKPKNE